MKFLNRIWPWSKIALVAGLNVKLDTQLKLIEKDRDHYRGRCFTLEDKLQEIKVQQAKPSQHSPETQKIKSLESQVHSLKLKLAPYINEAVTDVRRGKIMADNQQATDVKFREVKRQNQVLKKLNKQAIVAIRYASQSIQSNAIKSDLSKICEVINPENINDLGIENMSSADMVQDTRQMRDLIKLSNGKDANA